ncbi:hypothetical protein [Massilia phosphatilytica]
MSWNLRWRPNDRWTISTDLQRIRATTSSFDSTVATGVQMPSESIDLRGDVPTLSFTDADRAYLANPELLLGVHDGTPGPQQGGRMGVAHRREVRLRPPGAARHPFRRAPDGSRLAQRETRTRATTGRPSPRRGRSARPNTLSSLAYLGDPRFNNQVQVHSFKNFFNNNTSVPGTGLPGRRR